MKLSLKNKNKENSKKLQSSLIKETGCQNPNNFQTVISHHTLCVSFIFFSFIYLFLFYINWEFHTGIGVLTKSTPIHFPPVPPLRASSSLHVCSPHSHWAGSAVCVCTGVRPPAGICADARGPHPWRKLTLPSPAAVHHQRGLRCRWDSLNPSSLFLLRFWPCCGSVFLKSGICFKFPFSFKQTPRGEHLETRLAAVSI